MSENSDYNSSQLQDSLLKDIENEEDFKLKVMQPIEIDSGELVIILGATASGKTALINALLGEMMGDNEKVFVR